MLYSLPSSYDNFRCVIELRDNVPEPEALRIKIAEAGDAHNRAVNKSEDGALMANRGMAGDQGRKKTNWKGKSRYDNRICYKCNKKSHIASRCHSTMSYSASTQDSKQGDVYLVEDEAKPMVGASTSQSWYLDSSCTSHICKDEENFANLELDGCSKVRLANCSSTGVSARGDVKLLNDVNGVNISTFTLRSVRLEETLYVKDLRTNLISVAKITDKGNQVIFRKDGAVVKGSDGSFRLIADRVGHLYYIRESTACAQTASDTTEISSLRTWHCRLGHLNENYMRRMVSSGFLE